MDTINNSPVMPPKHHNIVAMVIFIIVAVLVTVLLLYLIGWVDFPTTTENLKSSSVKSLEQETNDIDLGNLDQEFIDLDASIEGL